jgi:hypothetical protein
VRWRSKCNHSLPASKNSLAKTRSSCISFYDKKPTRRRVRRRRKEKKDVESRKEHEYETKGESTKVNTKTIVMDSTTRWEEEMKEMKA